MLPNYNKSLLKQEIEDLLKENLRLQKEVKQKDLNLNHIKSFIREAENKLLTSKDNEEKLHQALDLSNDAVFFIHSNGNIVNCNKTAVEKFQFNSEEELKSHSILDMFDAENKKKLSDAFNDGSLLGNENSRIEGILTTKRGKPLTGQIRWIRTTSEKDIIILLIKDITLQKNLETQQYKQETFQKKHSILIHEITGIDNVNDLTSVMSKQILNFTMACEMWCLHSGEENKGEKLKIFSYNKSGEVQVSKFINNFTNHTKGFLSIIKKPLGGYLLEKDAVISLNDFDQPEYIAFQYIININLPDEEWVLLGLNFYKPLKQTDCDIKFLNSLSNQLQPAFTSIYATEVLKEKEEKFRALTEKNSDITVVRDINGKYTYVSPSIIQYGVQQNDILGKTAIEIIDQKDLDRVFNAVSGILHETGKWVAINNVAINPLIKKNAIVDLKVTNLIENKSVRGLVINIRDISEHVKLEKKIIENEKRLTRIFNSMQDGAYLCTEDFRIEFMNEAMKEQFGNNYHGKKCFNFIYGNTNNCEWCVAKDLTKDEHRLIEVFNPNNNRHYQISKSLIESEKGFSVLHISRDITEIKKAELLARLNEEKFRNIFNTSNDVIFITDMAGNYLEVNDKAMERGGFTKDEFLNMNFTSIVENDNKNLVNQYLVEVSESNQATVEIKYFNKFLNKEIIIEVNGKLTEYSDKPAIIHISRDITRRKEVEREIILATIRAEEKERSRFARDLHDGIGPYLSAAKLLLKTLSCEEDETERKNISDKSIQAIDEIIRNVKEISNNISPHVLENFGLLAAVQSFSKKLMIETPHIEINSNIQDDRFNKNLEISAFRILIELINNTVKYAEATKVKIAIMSVNNGLLIQFNHNGKGFNVEKILQQKKGSGLFNIITRVNSLGGKYEFQTTEQSSFYFTAQFYNLKK